MADVDDRGQLLIVGALTFAVMLVALAVLLNAAIYTGTVATRDAGTGSGEAIEYQGETTAMASDTMASLNARENASYADLRINFTTSVDAWSRAASTHASAALADAEVETLGDPTRGTKIQQDGERNFTSAGEAANWTVANDTTARAFRMNVSQSSLATPNDITEELLTDSSPSYFHAEFDDGSSVYRVQLRGTDDPDDSIVRVLDGAGNQLGDDCRVTPDDGRLLVNLTDASVDGGYCPALDAVFEGLDDGYTVSYANGENAEGTYSLVVDRRIDRLDTGADTSGDTLPTATRALYDADLRLTYRSEGVYYRTEFTVAPGVADD